jgi:polysaccharide biosynthesis/export protein
MESFSLMKPASTILKRTRLILVSLTALYLFGCIGLIPSPFRPSPGPQKTPQPYDLAEAFDIVCRNYRLGPDDKMSILFQTDWNIPVGSFKLDTLDKIRITCLIDPQLSSEVTIRPDGMITVKGIGEVQAAGLKPDELAKKIEQRYLEAKIFSSDITKRDIGNFRLVTVEVIQFYEKIAKLIEALRSLATGTAFGVLVKPDGTIDLPLLKDRVLCSGYTVQEVENTANRLYRDGVLDHLVVSLSLQTANSRKVYVMGEVTSPGAYDLTQPITALHALALAGGHKRDTGDLTSVILISRDAQGKPFGRRLDLKKILDVGDMSSAILVKPYDVLFVPNTYISDVRLFMDQYVATVSGITSLVNSLRPTGGQ